MSKNEERSLVRSNRTYRVNEPMGEAGYVVKLDSTQIEELAGYLAAQDQGAGVTIFFNVYENESQYEDSATYLSTTFDIVPTEEQEQSGGNSKFASKKSKAAASRANVRAKLKGGFKSAGGRK